ncbi:MAG: hypothetical protein AAF558_07155 [Verrucomicrobiota bacterium]
MNKKVWAIVAGALSVVYLLNPSAGFIEVIPDNLPFVGNLDEATVTAILIWAISVIRGKDISQDPVESAKPAQKADE